MKLIENQCCKLYHSEQCEKAKSFQKKANEYIIITIKLFQQLHYFFNVTLTDSKCQCGRNSNKVIQAPRSVTFCSIAQVSAFSHFCEI